MMKYLLLKNGQYISENVICFVGAENGEIVVEYIDGAKTQKATAETAEPFWLDAVIVAIRDKLAREAGQ